MSGNKSEITLELQDVCRKLQEMKSAIEVGVDSLESGKKARDVQKKEILLRQMKQVLATIDDTETNIIKDLKGEAFDLLRSISKISEAATAMKDTVNNGAQDDAKFKNDIEALKVEDLAFETITDAIFLHTPVLHLK